MEPGRSTDCEMQGSRAGLERWEWWWESSSQLQDSCSAMQARGIGLGGKEAEWQEVLLEVTMLISSTTEP